MLLFSDTVAADPVRAAIQSASRRTGADFSYLLATAQRESSLDPSAKAPTSSAAGLFQFIEQTWLRMVRDTGSEHGLGALAAQIETTGNGRAVVRDAEARRELLSLRYDAETASLMAGELTEHNRQGLKSALGREPEPGELYIAHFLGLSGAKSFIRMAETQPDAVAAAAFPSAARANKPIFYAGGAARSMADVYDNLIAKHAAVEMDAGDLAGDRPRKGLLASLFSALFGGGGRGTPDAATKEEASAGLAPARRAASAVAPTAFAAAEPAPSVQDLFGRGAGSEQRLGPIAAKSAGMFAALYADAPQRPAAERDSPQSGAAQITRSSAERDVPSTAPSADPVAAAFVAAKAARRDDGPAFWSAEPLSSLTDR